MDNVVIAVSVFLFIAIITVIIVFAIVALKKEKESVKNTDDSKLPYLVKDNFLTETERSFYHTLRQCVGEKATICPKVGLKDIFFISKGISNDYMKYFGKMSQKHVDFLLCEPNTMKPLCGIELDDVSHTNKKSYERDLFIEKAYSDANFKLIRFSSKSGYVFSEIKLALDGIFEKTVPALQNNNEVVLCPKCGIPMTLRKAIKGQNAGKVFYGCTNYPNCKEVKY